MPQGTLNITLNEIKCNRKNKKSKILLKRSKKPEYFLKTFIFCLL